MSREFSGGAALNIAAYLRRSDIETLNGDDSDFEACDDSSRFVCIDADDAMPVADTAGQLIVAAPELLGATINRTTTQQDGRGISLQIASPGAMETTRGRWLAGLSLDDGEIDFSGNTELGALDPTRRAVPGGAIVADSQTELQAASRSVGLYLAYTAFPSDSVSVSLSGRYNRTDVTLRDRLGTALDGDHEFSKLNPALGVTWEARDNLTLFASIGQSNRAPSPVELTCADADAPCRLPNAFLSDPPLEQVVARTAEAGLRGSWRMGAWNIGLFDTQTRDEILFISAGALTNQGFFANVGETRRRGIEGGIHGELDERLSWSLSYSLLDATFRSGFQVPSPNHPFANDGETTVAVGDRLPLTPERQFKASLRFSPTARFRVSGDLQVSSGAYFRGDEANEASELSEFAVVNVRASYALTDSLSVFLKVDNLLDESYRTFGVFGQPDEVLGEEFDDPRFVSPGAPRSGWIGFEASF